KNKQPGQSLVYTTSEYAGSPINFVVNFSKVFNIMKSKRADDRIEFIVKVNIFDGQLLIFDRIINLIIFGSIYHFFRNINTNDSTCALFSNIITMPSIATAKIKDILSF